MLSHHIVFVRYSGGALREMEDSALAALCSGSELKDWTLRVIDNWDVREPLTALWNRTMVESHADVVTFLNSDCWVAPGWDVAMLTAFERHAALACAGPQANMGGQTVPAQAGTPTGHDPAELVRIASACRKLWPGMIRDARIYGFCLSVRCSAWKELGRFDERIPLYGADDEFCARARSAGLRVACVMDAYCWHQGEASVRAAQCVGRINLDEERERGRQLFADATKKIQTP